MFIDDAAWILDFSSTFREHNFKDSLLLLDDFDSSFRLTGEASDGFPVGV